MLCECGVPWYVQNSRKKSTPEMNIVTKSSSHDVSELKAFILHLPTPKIIKGNKRFAEIHLVCWTNSDGNTNTKGEDYSIPSCDVV